MKNILIVDDDREVSRSLANLFDPDRFRFYFLEDGQKVIEFVKEHKDIEYSEVNAYDHRDQVMELGFRTVPTIVVDGKVWMTGVPTEEQLKGLLSK